MRYWPALAIAVALFAAGCTSSSSPTAASPTKPTFTADLKPANEVPPVTNAESNGSGNATITFDLTKDAAGNVTAASATFVVNLNGFPANTPINAAHIHEGASTCACPVRINTNVAALNAHGGSRRDIKLCVLCHQPQTTDPDTGNTVDMKVMAHKIHNGDHLPSVLAGKPYQIIGNAQSLHDFSTVAFPQEIRNCATCHEGSVAANKGAQSNVWYTNPSRAACRNWRLSGSEGTRRP